MQQKLIYSKLWHTLGALYVITVIVLTVMSNPPIKLSFAYADKIGHFIVYFGLMGWYTQIIRKPVFYWLLVPLFAAMGLALEFVQGMGTTRLFEWADALANTLGVLTAALVGLSGFRYWLAKLESKFANRH